MERGKEEISLKEVILRTQKGLRYLLGRWKIILGAVILGGTVGFYYAKLDNPVYIGEVSFALEDDKNGGMSGALGLASQFGIDLGGGGGAGIFSSSNLPELIKSRSIVEKALTTPIAMHGDTTTLLDHYIDFSKYNAKWTKDKTLSGLNFKNYKRNTSRVQDSLIGRFCKQIIKQNLSVEKNEKELSILKISVSSEDEQFSKLFPEALAAEVSDFYIQTRTKKASDNLSILQHQTDSVKRELNYAIRGVALSNDNNPNPNPALQILRTPSQRRTVDVQANQAILTELVKNLELAKISLRKETPLIQVIDRPVLPLERRDLSSIVALMIGSGMGLIFSLLFLTVRKLYKIVITQPE